MDPPRPPSFAHHCCLTKHRIMQWSERWAERPTCRFWRAKPRQSVTGVVPQHCSSSLHHHHLFHLEPDKLETGKRTKQTADTKIRADSAGTAATCAVLTLTCLHFRILGAVPPRRGRKWRYAVWSLNAARSSPPAGSGRGPGWPAVGSRHRTKWRRRGRHLETQNRQSPILCSVTSCI